MIETPGIEFKILKIDHGVGVIKVTDPNALLPDLKSVLLHKEFSHFYDNIDKLPIIDWNDAKDCFNLKNEAFRPF